MADGPERDPINLARILDQVRWEYDPQRDDVSPLLPAERFFDDFPWEDDAEESPTQSQ